MGQMVEMPKNVRNIFGPVGSTKTFDLQGIKHSRFSRLLNEAAVRQEKIKPFLSFHPKYFLEAT